MKENKEPKEAKHTLPKMNEKIELSLPLKVQGQEIKELTMRRCTVGDQLRANRQSQDQGEREVIIITALVDLTPDDMEKMDFKDYLKCQEVYKSFLA